MQKKTFPDFVSPLMAQSAKEPFDSQLGALLLGAYQNGKLHCFGHAGSGFSNKGLREAIDRMKTLFTDKSPFMHR